MKYITIMLMKYQLRKAKRQQRKNDNTIVKQAFEHLIENYKSTIMFLDANN